MKRNWLMAAAAVAVLACATGAAAASEGISSPRVLSPSDVRLYREAFAAEREGQFARAQALTAEISDRSLIGYVEAEHFLSPRARHLQLKQLTAWLDKYDDLPIAAKVRELAEKKNKRHKVAIETLPSFHKRGGGYEESDLPEQPLSSDLARAAQTQIEVAIHAGQPVQAEATLATLAGTASGADFARLSHRVALSYMAEGQDDAAVRVASAVTGYDRVSQPLLDWDQGIASYRLGKYDDAAAHFETLAQSGAVPNYTRSAAAFWAARSHMAAGDPLRVVTLLTAATREQPTFYGLLAQKMLGQENRTAFAEPVLDQESFDEMMQVPAAHRAVALWQVGETETLSGEMDRALAAIDLNKGPAYAALAHRLDLPNLELRACETAASRGVMLTGLFPVPRYLPRSGYQVDPSLVLAFTRAESRFRPDAVSNTGARGLMQLMPGTAAHIGGVPASQKELEDPSTNLDLGQRYLTELLGQMNGNLVELAAAYNAGPGALTRWVGTRGTMMQDPLLFIESLPAGQTREYVKKVLTYYWMYAQRTGEAAPTLDETASGKWPKYRSYDATRLHASNIVVSDAGLEH